MYQSEQLAYAFNLAKLPLIGMNQNQGGAPRRLQVSGKRSVDSLRHQHHTTQAGPLPTLPIHHTVFQTQQRRTETEDELHTPLHSGNRDHRILRTRGLLACSEAYHQGIYLQESGPQ